MLIQHGRFVSGIVTGKCRYPKVQSVTGNQKGEKMVLKQWLGRMVPPTFKNQIKIYTETRRLSKEVRRPITVDHLIEHREIDLAGSFNSESAASCWAEVVEDVASLKIPDGTGGVNPGDRRALFHLISSLKPVSVLEVGTHIGSSTVHIASALKHNGNASRLITVDIADVNSPDAKPWLGYGVPNSPIEMLRSLDLDGLVEFVTSSSVDYARICDSKFDFIFLDGDHSAITVYLEVVMALNLLSDGGTILLHDYYPEMRPLWSDGAVIPGPYLGLERLRQECGSLTVVPLGQLPWPTKSNSDITSLALLAKN